MQWWHIENPPIHNPPEGACGQDYPVQQALMCIRPLMNEAVMCLRPFISSPPKGAFGQDHPVQQVVTCGQDVCVCQAVMCLKPLIRNPPKGAFGQDCPVHQVVTCGVAGRQSSFCVRRSPPSTGRGCLRPPPPAPTPSPSPPPRANPTRPTSSWTRARPSPRLIYTTSISKINVHKKSECE